MANNSQPTERNLHFTFQKEGFFNSSYVFNLHISNLPKPDHVGISRDLVLPLYDILRESFDFLDSDFDNAHILNYKGKRDKSSRENIVQVYGQFKNADSQIRSEEIVLLQNLSTTFSKYEDGNVYYDYHWHNHQNDTLKKPLVTVDELLVGVSVYLDRIRLAVEEYAKVGFVHKLLNIPSAASNFEISMDSSFQMIFSIKKKISSEMLQLFFELVDCLSDIFDFDTDVNEKLQDIKSKLQIWCTNSEQ